MATQEKLDRFVSGWRDGSYQGRPSSMSDDADYDAGYAAGEKAGRDAIHAWASSNGLEIRPMVKE